MFYVIFIIYYYIFIFQDFYLSTDFINSDEAVITEAEDETMGPVNSSESNNRPKWSMSGPVQCSECFRTFATSRRSIS